MVLFPDAAGPSMAMVEGLNEVSSSIVILCLVRTKGVDRGMMYDLLQCHVHCGLCGAVKIVGAGAILSPIRLLSAVCKPRCRASSANAAW